MLHRIASFLRGLAPRRSRSTQPSDRSGIEEHRARQESDARRSTTGPEHTGGIWS